MNWKYFKLEEFIRSNTAEKFNIDNTPGKYELENLNNLVSNILDPLREYLKNPIKITSGYRSYLLNKMVGGVKNSHHLSGKAADIVPINLNFDEFVEKVKEFLKDKEFCQCIIEKKGNSRWIHISYDKNNNKKEFKIINK